MSSPSIEEVRSFWEQNPLFEGEVAFEVGSQEYFDFQRDVFVNDVFVGEIDPRLFPDGIEDQKILDLGCGPGFWTIEFALRGCPDVTGADLTDKALEITDLRRKKYGVTVKLRRQNAEKLDFQDATFTHVHCQGVIHHTPNPQHAVREIARVLVEGGTANISVYYKNFVIRNWQLFRWLSKLLGLLGAKLSGRGRERIFQIDDVDDLVRQYDGKDNPIGSSYTKDQFRALLEPYFEIEEMYLHYFPARSLPFRIPRPVHQWLDRNIGLMIYANVRRKI